MLYLLLISLLATVLHLCSSKLLDLIGNHKFCVDASFSGLALQTWPLGGHLIKNIHMKKKINPL